MNDRLKSAGQANQINTVQLPQRGDFMNIARFAGDIVR